MKPTIAKELVLDSLMMALGGFTPKQRLAMAA